METLIIKQYIIYRVKAKIKITTVDYMTFFFDLSDAYSNNY